jgi:hypothetical protein
MLTNVSRAWAGKPPSADEVRKRKAEQPRFGSIPTPATARFLKGIHRACILAADVRRGFLLHDHIILVRRLEFAAKPTEYFR